MADEKKSLKLLKELATLLNNTAAIGQILGDQFLSALIQRTMMLVREIDKAILEQRTMMLVREIDKAILEEDANG